jgi:hypothetical protein
MRGHNRYGRKSVQTQTSPAPRCTDLSIDVSVQDGDRPAILPLMQVRANLRRIFEGKRVVIVGRLYHPRAVIIPLGPSGYLSTEEKRARNKRLNAQLKQTQDLLGD